MFVAVVRNLVKHEDEDNCKEYVIPVRRSHKMQILPEGVAGTN